MIVVNPDNPSGNFIPKYELIRLINWASTKNLRLIVDGSFVDFADILSANKHLCVVKSLSKSHGIGGLRQGVLASGDTNFIAELKRDAAIWNINSFAEF